MNSEKKTNVIASGKMLTYLKKKTANIFYFFYVLYNIDLFTGFQTCFAGAS